MKNVQLDITGIGVIDLGEHESSPFKLTKSLSDISILRGRSDTRSTEFVIPDSKENVKALKAFFDSRFANKEDIDAELPCSYIIGGKFQELGTVKVNTAKNNEGFREFVCVYFSGNLEWWRALKNYTIATLDWSDVGINSDGVFERSYAHVSGSWSNTEGVVFPLIDRGRSDQPLNEVRVNSLDFYPELFVKTIIDKMFEAVGFSYDSTFLNSAEFKRYILTYSGDRFVKHTSTEERIAKTRLQNNAAQTTFPYVPVSNEWAATSVNVRVSGATVGAGSWSDVNDPLNELDNTEFVSSLDQYYTVRHEINFLSDRNTPPPVYIGFYTVVRDPSGNTVSTHRTFADKFEIPQTGGDQSIMTEIEGVYIPTGYKATLAYQVWREDVDPNFLSEAVVRLNSGTTTSYIPSENNNEIPLGGSYTISEVWDNVTTCFDWFNDFSRAFNLYFETDTALRKVRIEPRDDFYEDLSDAEDWSERLDASKEIVIQYNSKLHVQDNSFAYADDGNDGRMKIYNEGRKHPYMSYTHRYPDKFEKGSNTLELKNISGTFPGIYWDSVPHENNRAVPPITAQLWTEDSYTSPDRSTRFKSRLLEYNFKHQPTNVYIKTTDSRSTAAPLFLTNWETLRHFQLNLTDKGTRSKSCRTLCRTRLKMLQRKQIFRLTVKTVYFLPITGKLRKLLKRGAV